MTGIEPASSAWKAGVLPLNYIRLRCVLDTSYTIPDACLLCNYICVPSEGIEPPYPVCKTGALPLS